MSTNYAMDQSWNMQNQYNPSQQIQLEEEYYGSVSGQAHPQQPGLSHNIPYPLTTPGPYRANPINFSQRPAAQRSLGNQPYGTNGINGNTFDHNGQDLFANPQVQSAAFNRTPNGTNGYYHNPSLPYHPPYPGEVQGPTTPATGLAPEPLVVDTTIDGSLTPGRQFSTSPMSLPLTFGSQDQSQGQAQYHTEVQNQQQFQFNMRPSSDGGPGGGHDSEHSHTIKRARADEEEEYGFGIDVGMDHEGGDGDGKDSGKAKPLGACARCKSLKVKCEFKTAEDPCKRCMNAGKDCVIPGRKKRRTPPKREHLLTQIREQANQISKLMAQLESTKRQPKPITANLSAISHSSPAADLHSPLDPTSPDSQSPAATADVEEWISRARQSIEAFGGFIGAGGAGMMKSFLVDEDPEDSGSSGDDYEFALEDEDGETGEVENYNSQDAGLDMDKRRSSSREKESVSGNSVGSGVPRKKDSGGTQKLATLPSEAVPFGLIANLSLKHSRRKSSSNVDDEDDVGVANEDFFRPSPTPDPMRSSMLGDNRQAPHILIRGIVTPDEAEMLFRIFFDNMGLSISLLDPVLYTAQKTCWRSPFLFTVICAVASRYYTEKPELYPALMNYAQLAAGTALISGQKSIEMCQAYILLSLYPVPARRWEDDRSWIYLGLAIRIAVDLNIHLPNTAKPMNEQHAREMLNRTRVWLNCFNLDRSTGSQYGKKPIIDNADFVANHSGHWWESSEYNMKNFDIQICGYNAELRVMAEFVKKIYSNPQHPTGLNKDVDLQLLAIETDDKLKSLGDIWMARLDQTDQTDPQNRFRTGLLRLAYSYARLAALSFGFQHAFGKNKLDENPFLSRCLAAAFDVVHTYVNDVGRPAQRIYLRHGPEAQSVFATFACAFLVKLLQPKFAEYLSREKRLEIRSQIEKVADLLGSPEVAIDDRHGPKLYSRFLKGLLATPIASVDAFSPTGVTSTKSLPQRRSTRKQKSGSGLTPDSERSFELSPTNGTNLTSPISPSALSPPPEAAFDVFAPMTGYYPPVTSQTQYASRASASPSVGDPTSMNTSDWFPTPLPFDSELVQSMQSVQEMWSQDVSMPGFNWMNNFQANNNDIYMQSDPAGGAMFDPRLYNIKTPPP